MNNILLVLLGFIFAITGCVIGWTIASRYSKNARRNLLNQIQQAEKELSEDISRAGIENLSKTESGRKLINLLEAKDPSFLLEEIPNLDVALEFTERSLSNINLSIEEWRVVKFVTPQNTIRQIAQANGMSEFEIRNIVHGLLTAGLVRMVLAIKESKISATSDERQISPNERVIAELSKKGVSEKEEI